MDSDSPYVKETRKKGRFSLIILLILLLVLFICVFVFPDSVSAATLANLRFSDINKEEMISFATRNTRQIIVVLDKYNVTANFLMF